MLKMTCVLKYIQYTVKLVNLKLVNSKYHTHTLKHVTFLTFKHDLHTLFMQLIHNRQSEFQSYTTASDY